MYCNLTFTEEMRWDFFLMSITTAAFGVNQNTKPLDNIVFGDSGLQKSHHKKIKF